MPWSRPDLPSVRPNGCMPAPTICTSVMEVSPKGSDGAECVARDGRAVGAVERHELEAHGHADFQARKIVDLDAALDDHLIGELDVTHSKRLKRRFVVGACIGRRFRAKSLDRE